MLPRVSDYDTTGLIARCTLVVAPLLAFGAFPLRPAFSFLMGIPAVILGAAYLTRPARRIPVWELGIVALLMLSLLWGDVPDYSQGRLRAEVPILLAAIAAANVVQPRTAMRCLKASVAVMIVSATVLIIVDPAARSADGYSGLAVHGQFPKNGFGGLLVLALVLVVCSRPRNSFLLVVPLVVLIALNQSSTAYVTAVALIAAILVLRFLANKRGAPDVATLVWLALSGAALTVLLVLSSSSIFLNLLGKDPSLSSRTKIWAACWEEIQKSPILGYGAYTFLDTDSRSPATLRIWSKFSVDYLPPHPHNGLLDVWGQLGIIGVVVFAALVIRALRAGVVGARLRSNASLTALACIVFALLFGITEVTYLGSWLVVTVICAAAVDTGRLDRNRSSAGDHVGPRRPVELVSTTGGRHRSTPAPTPVGVG